MYHRVERASEFGCASATASPASGASTKPHALTACPAYPKTLFRWSCSLANPLAKCLSTEGS